MEHIKGRQTIDASGTVNATAEKGGLGARTVSVVIDGIKQGIETPESFAIKFSLLSSVPISKIKHLVHRLPVVIWTGDNEARAKQLLVLIDEAGGTGKIVERASIPQDDNRPELAAGAGPDHRKKVVCPKCGFPMSGGERYCEFCMTPVGESPSRHEGPPSQIDSGVKAGPDRRVLYLVIGFAVLVIVILLVRG